MDYEKKYKEALERARKLKENPKAIFFEEENTNVSDYIFPELKESEDERIRNELIGFIKKRDRSGCDYDYDKWLAWLEKQGEQILANSAKTCQNLFVGLEKQGEKKPTWKPSDEQMDALQYIYRNLNPPLSDKLGWSSIRTLELLYNDLKKLREKQ